MATINRIIAGLQIFAKYGGGDRYSVQAEHDVIYSGPEEGMAMTEEDKAALDKIGWHFDDTTDCWQVFT